MAYTPEVAPGSQGSPQRPQGRAAPRAHPPGASECPSRLEPFYLLGQNPACEHVICANTSRVRGHV